MCVGGGGGGVAVMAHPLHWRLDSPFTLQDWHLVLLYISGGVVREAGCYNKVWDFRAW